MVSGFVGNVIASGFSLTMVLVGVYLVRKGREAQRPVEGIAETETTRIRDVRPGRVAVTGTARPPADTDPLQALFDDGRVLAADLEVKAYRTDHEGMGVWTTIHEETRSVPFIVDDGTAEVRIDPPAAFRLNVEQSRTEVDAGEDPPGSIARFLQEGAVDQATIVDLGLVSVDEHRRYLEGGIEPGEAVYVHGRASEPEAEWDSPDLVVDTSPDTGEFIVSDKSETELVDEGKWRGKPLYLVGGIIAIIGLVLLVAPWLPG